MGLDDEERQILEAYEQGRLQSIPDLEAEKARLIESARQTLQKDKRVSVMLSGRDLAQFQKKAVEEGLPIQALMANVLHKFINGRLNDAPPVSARAPRI